jgi:hypothetical protein
MTPFGNQPESKIIWAVSSNLVKAAKGTRLKKLVAQFILKFNKSWVS